MKLICKLWLAFAFLSLPLQVLQSQSRSDYELLWEIKHKDGIKKSYLFGTLHLKDARAFKFSDSVIPSIAKSEMFALEIHPDSAISSYKEKYYNLSNKNIFKKILSPEEYTKLKKRFYDVNEIDLDSFPLQHPSLITSMLSSQKEKPDDRRTFLDAYLYGIAYNYQKEITGLEKVEDQIPEYEDFSDAELRESILSLLDNDLSEDYDEYDEITQLYYEGDLDKILDFVNSSSIDEEYMKRRNNVMLNSLEKHMKDKTIFAAVGAAHLPGKNGLINLLKQEGYQVTKVEATFEDNEKQYDIIPNLNRWVKDTNDLMGYSVLTPTEAIDVPVNEKVVSKTSSDLIYGGNFIYITADLRSQVLKKDFDVVENIIKSQAQHETDTILSKKTFIKDDIEFTEVLIKKKDNHTRIQTAFQNKIIYLFMTENNMDELYSEYVNAFFNSIKIFTPKHKPSVWQEHVDVMGAYSITVPEKFQNRSQTRENPNGDEEAPYIINIFSAEDKANKTTYLLRYNDQPLGYYMSQKELYYEEFDAYFKEHGSVLKEPEDIEFDGNKGKEYELLFSDKYHTIAKLFLRGNRTYMLMAQKQTEGEKLSKDNEFFNSFTFLPYADAAFDTLINIQDKYSFRAPSNQVITEEETQEAYSEYSTVYNYSALDPNTSGTYLVQYLKLKPYYRKQSLQEFYDSYVELLTEYKDSITSNISTTFGGKPAREIRITNSTSNVKQRMKLLLDDDTIVLFLTYLGDEEIDAPRVDTFFNSLEIKKKTNNFKLTESKAKLIFKNLKSKDSLKFEEALGALSYYEFDASEYKLLEKNLRQDFKDDTTYYGTKSYILDALISLETPNTLKTFTDFYKDKKNTYYTRLEVLDQLLLLENENAPAAYLDLIENYKPERKPNVSYSFMSYLTDTIPLFVENDKLFSKLIDVDDYRSQIVPIYAYNISGDSIYKDKMPLLKNKILSHMYADAQIFVDTLARKKHDYIDYSLLNSYVEFIKENNTKNEIVEPTIKLLAENLITDDWIKAQALMASIKLDIDIDSEILNTAIEDLYSRFEIMESMVESNKTHLIPESYLEPEEFAKLSLYNNVGDDYDGYPTVFELLGEVVVKEKDYYVFSYSYFIEEDAEDVEDEDTIKYLGIVEKTKVDFTNFEMANSFTNWEQPKSDWKTQARSTITENTLQTETE